MSHVKVLPVQLLHALITIVDLVQVIASEMLLEVMNQHVLLATQAHLSVPQEVVLVMVRRSVVTDQWVEDHQTMVLSLVDIDK